MTESHRIAEAAMDSFWEFKELGEFDRGFEMLRSFGLRPNVVEFVTSPDSYYFPNQRGNQLIRPKSVSDEKIPVVALEVGEKYWFEAPALHSLQRNALLLAGCTLNDVELLDREFAAHGTSIEGSGGVAGTGSVARSLETSPKLPEKRIESGPRLILNIDRTATPGQIDFSPIALHEITHVAQTLSEPFWKDDYLRAELEAYAVQATLMFSDRVPYDTSIAMAGTVDNFRRKWLGKDEFETTPDFERAFAQDMILSKVYGRLGRAS